jgi:hypothetical protein
MYSCYKYNAILNTILETQHTSENVIKYHRAQNRNRCDTFWEQFTFLNSRSVVRTFTSLRQWNKSHPQSPL